MKLTDLLSTDRQKAEVSQNITSDAAKTASINRQIRAMTPGQTIQAEVVAKSGNEVQIRLSEDMLLNARLEQNLNIDIGKLMNFEVRNNGKALVLSPLFANTATDANALKALDMASLPINNTTVNMTSQLMDAGLPIDRNSLQQVFREINAFPEAEVSDIVDLHRLSMPVNEGNVAQIGAYKNLNYQIATGMNQVVDELYNTMNNMLQSGNVEGAAKIYQELLQNLLGDKNTVALSQEQAALQNTVQNGQAGNATNVIADIVQGTGSAAELSLNGEQGTLEMLAADAENISAEASGAQSTDAQVGQTLTLPQNMTESQLLEWTNKMLQQGLSSKDGELLTELLKNKELQDILKENLRGSFALSPEDVAEPEKVDDLYSRLDKQLKGLTNVLEQTGQTGTEAFKAVNNMTQNLDFLQQLNQMYTYVQLPLKLQQGNAHGDLYVYTNKKSLAAKDGKVSALLHLDMENLGPVDVYVALQNQNVNTQFYLQDEELLDFLGEHMNLLTERLKKRGYDCSYQMQVRGQDASEGDAPKGKGGVHNLLVNSGHMTLAQYAFDVRA